MAAWRWRWARDRGRAAWPARAIPIPSSRPPTACGAGVPGRETRKPPAAFAGALAARTAVLLTIATGAREFAGEGGEGGRPIVAVGAPPATTAEGLGFSAVSSAAGDGTALVELV